MADWRRAGAAARRVLPSLWAAPLTLHPEGLI